MSTQTQDDIAAWLLDALAERTGLDARALDVHAPFADFGLPSRELVGLSGELQSWLGRRIPPTIFWEHPSIHALSAHLARGRRLSLPARVSAKSTSRAAPTVSARSNSSERPPSASSVPSASPVPEVPSAGAADDVAIVGLSCRFPGAADAEAFWSLLEQGRDGLSDVPPERWDASAWYASEPATPGKMSSRRGGFLKAIDGFDANLFQISGREAARIDPQQRLLLEAVWETLESASIAPESLVGSATGVFVGISSSDYARLQFADPGLLDAYAATGNAHSIAANRISYVFGLSGPSMAVDTACSSSLVAVHLAYQSLLRGECDAALVGGVNLLLDPNLSITFSQARMLSPTGRCHTFSAQADGYVRGEGCGMVLLKRLADAQADGDRVLAVVRGSAINQDGRSNGLTAPNGLAQQAVIRRALDDAGIAPDELSYVEAHGTGTPLGDPIEVASLRGVLGDERAQPCWIGSVKTNVGHLEAAAGIAGLIKVVLALQHGRIPPHKAERPLNPYLDPGPGLEIAFEGRAWTADARRHAGVSSFGFGGTNAHVIVAEAPESARRPLRAQAGRAQALALSARSEVALDALAERYAHYLEGASDRELGDICLSANTGRATLAHRLVAVASSATEMRARLMERAQDVHRGKAADSALRVAFLFPGQGTQYPGMARQLYDEEPRVRAILERCDAHLRQHFDTPLLDALYRRDDPALLQDTRFAQPAVFAISYALASLWRSWGVEPVALLGHSIGEYAAACSAGVFGLEEGLSLIATRARLMHELPEPGTMLAVRASLERLQPFLERDRARISLAAMNGPSALTVAGGVDEIIALAAELERAGITCKRLKVSHGFHSPLMEPILAPLGQAAAETAMHAPAIPLIASAHGGFHQSPPTPAYWRAHTREPVAFAAGMETLAATGIDVFLEVGGHTPLIDMGRRFIRTEASWLASLRRQEPDCRRTLLRTASVLHTRGAHLDWNAICGPATTRRFDLPTYPFERKRFWFARGSSMHDTTSALPLADGREQRILHELRSMASGLLEVPAMEVDVDASFVEMGADSLVMIEAGRVIEAQYGVSIAVRQLFEELSSLRALAGYVAQQLPDERTIAPAAAAPAVSQPAVAAQFATPAPAPVPVQPAVGPVPVQPVAAPVQPAAAVAQPTSGLHALFSQQLQLMSQQLALLGQGAATGLHAPAAAVATPAVAAPNVAVHAPAPVATPAAVAPVPTPTAAAAAPAPVPVPAPAPATEQAATHFVPHQPPRTTARQVLTNDARQQAHLDEMVERYTTRTSNSKAITQRYRPVLADNRASAGFRFSIKEMLYPLVGDRSAGAKMWDVDGNEYIDITMGFGVNLFGHRPDFVEEALSEQLQLGYQLGPQTRLAGEVATLISELTGSERVAFCNSGTEAILTAIRIARTATQRRKIALFSGSYHGFYDASMATAARREGALHSVPMIPGIPPGLVEDIVVLPYGSEDSLRELDALMPELAAVLVEPVQSRRPDLQPGDFLLALRQRTREAGTVLIFDEIITGFRIAAGGAQAHFGVRADLVTYGKVVGGGMPIGVVAGDAALLDTLDGGAWQYGDDSFPAAETTFVAGTFCKHPLSLAAARAVLREIQRRGPVLYEQLNQRTEAFASALNGWFSDGGVPLRVVHFGSLFRFVYSGNLDLLFYHLAERGVYVWEGRNCFLSTAHTDEDVAALSDAIRGAVADLQRGGFLPGEPAPSPSVPYEMPLGPDQRHLWVLTQLGTTEAQAYNVPTAMALRGPLDVELLSRAIQGVVDRHETLRTTVSADGALQHIEAKWSIDLPVVDLGHLDGEAQEQALHAYFDELSRHIFDFTTSPAVLFRLVVLSEDHHVLCVLVHHLMVDGWSVANILRETGVLYSALLAGERPRLAPARQFRDYLRYTEQLQDSGAQERHAAYWRGLFADSIPVLDLPTDRVRPALKSCNGARHIHTMPAGLLADLKEFSRRQGATLFMTLLTGYRLLLHRLTRQPDVVVGIPAAARSFPGGDSVVGYCGNLLPTRSRLDTARGFAELVAHTRGELFEAYEHQDYSLAQLLDALNPPRDSSRATIVETLFNFEPPVPEPALGELRAQLLPQPIAATALDISINALEMDGTLIVYCDYNTDLFDEETIARWVGHYRTLLQAALAQPEQPAMLLPLLDDGERQRMLVDWNATERAFPLDRVFSQLFEQQVARTPEAVAVLDERGRYTYAELNARANRLARRLIEAGIEAGQLTALFAARSSDFLTAILAIFKAGGAYLPLDLQHPPQRLAQVLEQSHCRCILVERERGEVLEQAQRLLAAEDRAEVLTLEDILDGDQSDENLGLRATPDDLAYVLFTSGSTGLPKGAMIEQRGMVNHLYAKVEDLDLKAGDIVAQNARQSFDISVWQLLVALLVGGCTRIYDDETARDPEELLARTEADGVTILEVVPSLLAALLAGFSDRLSELPRLSALRWLLLTGEALPPKLCREWFIYYPRIPLLNAYGPTECSDDVSHEPIAEPPGAHVAQMPIGRPLANTQLYVLDSNRQPVPIGVPGELYVGGTGVGRGYLGDLERTRAVFLDDPFREGRFYRTGDLVRYLADGRIEYLGRIDHQVKIRGFRIELGEIEVALSEHPAVRQNVVLARQDRAHDKRLVAYVVHDPHHTEAGDDATAERLAQWNEVWKDTYGQLDGDTATDTIGWNDSYTREPFAPAVMQEWVESSVRNILEQQPTRVLELGCGTGMLLTRIAPYCMHYRGHDIASEVLDYVRANIAARPRPWTHVELAQHAAHDLSAIEPGDYDTVVINSVAQYFPDIEYLETVLDGAVEALAAGGRIYLGDVRDLRLQEALHTSVKLYQAADDVDSETLAESIAQLRELDQELLVHPDFFLALQRKLPRISHVDIAHKRGDDDNELTRFRYDVVLHIERPEHPVDMHIFDWPGEELDTDLVCQVLDEGQPDCLGVANVPNQRVAAACRAVELLHGDAPPATVAAFREALAHCEHSSVAPEAWHRLGVSERYQVRVTLARSGALDRYDVLFYRRDVFSDNSLPTQYLQLDGEPAPLSSYARRLSASQSEQRLRASLSSFLGQRLPDYMVPEAFVVLPELPLTPNGKIDRAALPEPELGQSLPATERVAPRNDVEERLAAIFAEILGVAEIGVHDDFFALGGHSLTGTQVVARVRSVCQIELPLRCLFEAPTVAQLSETVIARGVQPGTLASSAAPDITPIARRRAAQRILVDAEGFGSTGRTPAYDES